MSSTGLVFSVRAFDFSVDASNALVSGIAPDTITSDVIAEFGITLSQAQDLFHFQSDAVDVNDVTADDLRYKLIYSDPTKDENGVPDSSWIFDDFTTNTLCIGTDNSDHVYTVGTSGATNKAVSYDYVRYLAYKLFNTHLGVDLFSNETEVRDNLNMSARITLSDLLLAINDHQSNAWLDASACTDETPSTGFKDIYGADHPTYVIVQNILSEQKHRFNDMSDNFVSGDLSGTTQDAEFKVPFVSGDVIQFQLKIKADPTQHELVADAPNAPTGIPDRTYTIKINIQ
jgi:hypothetical protein